VKFRAADDWKGWEALWLVDVKLVKKVTDAKGK
jgi:hypothetical protein